MVEHLMRSGVNLPDPFPCIDCHLIHVANSATRAVFVVLELIRGYGYRSKNFPVADFEQQSTVTDVPSTSPTPRTFRPVADDDASSGTSISGSFNIEAREFTLPTSGDGKSPIFPVFENLAVQAGDKMPTAASTRAFTWDSAVSCASTSVVVISSIQMICDCLANRIGINGAGALASALKANSTATTLDLSRACWLIPFPLSCFSGFR